MKALVGATIVAVVKGVLETLGGLGQVSEEDLWAGRDSALAEISDIDLAELLARAKEQAAARGEPV
jgi:hypothetical protein